MAAAQGRQVERVRGQLHLPDPFVRKILEGGEREAWGAKTIPSGGYWALPRKMAVPGMVMCGDNAGMCNVSELKGIHYAMHAGMYGAEAIVEALKRDEVNFDAYDARVRNSAIAEELYRWRNVRQSFSKGFFVGGVVANMALLSGGRLPPDNKYTFDKLSSVFASGNATRDDAPNHIRVQREVPREVAQAWVSMCPAQVYEIPEEQLANDAQVIDLNITPSNCVQCGAITAKGGRLTPPEGGDGPLYQET
jgi:electron-transferring-flavoprotein dehydrogenase